MQTPVSIHLPDTDFFARNVPLLDDEFDTYQPENETLLDEMTETLTLTERTY